MTLPFVRLPLVGLPPIELPEVPVPERPRRYRPLPIDPSVPVPPPVGRPWDPGSDNPDDYNPQGIYDPGWAGHMFNVPAPPPMPVMPKQPKRIDGYKLLRRRPGQALSYYLSRGTRGRAGLIRATRGPGPTP